AEDRTPSDHDRKAQDGRMTQAHFHTHGGQGTHVHRHHHTDERTDLAHPHSHLERTPAHVSVKPDWEMAVTDGECRRPPSGWWCSRGDGHDGPCAARPDTRREHVTRSGKTPLWTRLRAKLRRS